MAHLDDLRPKTKKLCELWIEECRKNGINLVVTQTFRSPELQEAYYSQGRESLEIVNLKRKKVGLDKITEKENKIVTKAAPGSASCCAFVKMTMYFASAAMNSRSSSAWISMSI